MTAQWRHGIVYESTLYEIPCPQCGYGLDRAQDDWRFGGNDHTAVTVHPDRDEYEPCNPLDTRGGWVEIRYRCIHCPNNPRFVLAIANHKGGEFLRLGTP